jgi:ubiquitin-conjugating enzyme E2 C
MDYSMEDTQNSAPDAQQASKLNPSGQKSDTQSVTKRFVPFSTLQTAYNSV